MRQLYDQVPTRPVHPSDVRALLCVGLFFFVFLAAMTLGSTKAVAQGEVGQQEEEIEEVAPVEELEELEVADPRAGSVDVLEGRVRIPRPTGWQIAGANDEGVVATFRAASDRDAQIEIRVSSGVSSARWDRFVRTFDREIRESGFRVHQESARLPYGGRRGQFVEYELDLQEESFRLVVWHTLDGDRAWVFSGFFREVRRDTYFRIFEELLEQIIWDL